MIYLKQNLRNLFFITSRDASEDNKIDGMDAAKKKKFSLAEKHVKCAKRVIEPLIRRSI